MKASLVSVLAYRPRVIVLDEPLSGLDPLVRDQLMEGLLGEAGGATILFSSHDLAEVEHFANHVGYMEGGALLVSESTESVRKRFRKVKVRRPENSTEPGPLPAEWSRFSANGTNAEWVESHFSEEESVRRAHEALGEIELRSEPLSLREVFLTLAYRNRPHLKAGGAE